MFNAMKRLALLCFFLSLPALCAEGGFLPFDFDVQPAAAQRHVHRADAVPDAAGPLAVPAEWAIRLFQVFVSPQDGPSCMYAPTCSQYGYLSISRYGFFTGLLMTGDRWLRCNPFGYPGYDPPEDNYYGTRK
jgi:putative membrane protein insertion efficiency factor